MTSRFPDTEHVTCVSDFCGSHKSPGAWADLWKRANGTQFLTLGGGWQFYGERTPEIIEESDPHFKPFMKACDKGMDFAYAKKNWN